MKVSSTERVFKMIDRKVSRALDDKLIFIMMTQSFFWGGLILVDIIAGK